MLYIKAELADEIEIKVPFYGDNVFAICPICGVEHVVEEELLIELLTEGNTQVYCLNCSK